jgi:hypothetical protein
VVYVLPYGTAWALAALMAMVGALIGFMPRVLK